MAVAIPSNLILPIHHPGEQGNDKCSPPPKVSISVFGCFDRLKPCTWFDGPVPDWRLLDLGIALAVFGEILSRSGSLCDSLLGDKFTNQIGVEMMHHAVRLDQV